MKFLYFGDRHYKLTAPENRVDDYHESTKAKDLEIIELGKKHAVSAFLQPGDFWDTPNPPLDFASKIIKRWSNVDVFETLNKMVSKTKIDMDLFVTDYLRRMFHGEIHDIEEARKQLESTFTEEDLQFEKDRLEKQLKDYIPIIGLAGNHELFGNNLNTLPKTMLGFMEQLGVMRFATKENPYFFYTEDGLKIAITGTHYHLDIDKPEHIDDYVVEEKLGDIHIHMVHGYLTDKSKGDMFHHTVIDQIKHTKADLTITGHDHIGFPITEVDGKYFVNPGAVVRLSNDLKEINRQVKVLMIDVTKEHGLRLEEIPLKSAIKGDLVLSRKKIIERKKKESRLEEFKKAVRQAGVSKAVDITEIIRNIADNRNLPIGIRDKVVERISAKMQAMKTSDDIVVKDAYAEKIILENFQSHEYTELELSSGFNVLVGESKQGKTAILRAFQWIYENKPAGKRIIRKGADYARVTLHLSNGYVISRYIEAKRSGKNGYEITDPNTGEIEFHNTKILPEVQKVLGYTTLNIDKDLQLNLNMMKQGTGWFLIGDKFSGQQRAKVIGGIYGTQYADAVIREIDAEVKRLNEKSKDSTEALIKTNERLQGFDYLSNLKESIEFVETKLKEVEALKARKERIQKLLVKREQLVSNVNQNETILQDLQALTKVQQVLSDTKLRIERMNKLEHLLHKFDKTSKSLETLYYSLNVLKDLDTTVKAFNETKAQFERGNQLEKLATKHKELIKLVSEQHEICERTEAIDRAKRIAENLYKGIDKRNRIENLTIKYETFNKNIQEEVRLINNTNSVQQAHKLIMVIQQDVEKLKNIEFKVNRALELDGKRAKTVKSLNAINETLRLTESIPQGLATLEAIYKMSERKEAIVRNLVTREKTLQLISQEVQIVEESNKKLHQDIHKYQEMLEDEGKCPICFGTIDKATVNRIVSEFIKN